MEVGVQSRRIVRSNAIEDENTKKYEEIRKIRNNQIVLYRRKYKAYIQEVRITETGAWLERKRKTIREQ